MVWIHTELLNTKLYTCDGVLQNFNLSILWQEVSQVTWHGRGDYFASVMPKGDSMSVLIHQLSRRRSQVSHGQAKTMSSHPGGHLHASFSIYYMIYYSDYTCNELSLVFIHFFSESVQQVQRIGSMCSLPPSQTFPVCSGQYSRYLLVLYWLLLLN